MGEQEFIAGIVHGDSIALTPDDRELIQSNSNLFRNFGYPNAGLAQARAIVAAKIIGILDDRGFSTREAEKMTGVSHSEFSRIRNAQLRRFTLDRLRWRRPRSDYSLEDVFGD